LRILCAIIPLDAIIKILECLGLPSRPPPISPAEPDRNPEILLNELDPYSPIARGMYWHGEALSFPFLFLTFSD
jgi:hypothetical protein